MKTKHTPGPWKATRDPRTEYNYTIGCKKGILAFTDSAGCSLTPEEIEANARLIAAAPDLLAALQALTGNKHVSLGDLVYTVRENEGKGWDGKWVKAWGNAVKLAATAIAKATKETP